MILFPNWTDSEDLAERAKLRLRFVVHYLSSFVSASSSVDAFADEIGVSTSTIYMAQSRGRFTRSVATTIEAKFGEKTGVTRDMLTNPNFDILRDGDDGEL